LQRMLGREVVRTDSWVRQAYGYDATGETGLPAAVVFPRNRGDVQKVLEAANRWGGAVIPRGAGTNLSGGAVPLGDELVLVLTSLNRLEEVDEINATFAAGPGLVNLELQGYLQELGWQFAPDPASQKVSTLGGNVAENAGGPHCLKYGVTTNHILGLEVLLPDGAAVQVGGKVAGWPTYDWLALFAGSEGTLGVVTRILGKLIPLPEEILTILVGFPTLEQAGKAVSAIIAAGVLPAALELMDRRTVQAIEEALAAGYPRDVESVLIVELDGPAGSLGKQGQRVEELARQHGATFLRVAADQREREALWSGRRNAFACLARISPHYSVQDATVPRQHLPVMLRRVVEIAASEGVTVANIAHAGDGNLHPVILYDPRDPESVRRMRRANDRILGECVRLGGTITGEHGVGTEKLAALSLVAGIQERALLHRIRRALDPRGVLNPGRGIPECDSALPSHPSRLTPRYSPAELPVEIPGWQPGRCVRPADMDSLKAVMAGQGPPPPLLVAGRGSRLAEHPWLAQGTSVVLVDGLDSSVKIDGENLTVTAGTGVSCQQLWARLEERGMWCPALPGPSAPGTLGGLLGSGLAGPWAFRFGRPRDWVVGTRAVLPGGVEVRFGGRCVKNVAGYDLPRFLVGSWGSLAVLLTATLRLLPKPQAHAGLLVHLPSGTRMQEVWRGLLRHPCRPDAVLLLEGNGGKCACSGDSWGPGGPRIVMGFLGLEEDVAARCQRMEQLFHRMKVRVQRLDGGWELGAMVSLPDPVPGSGCLLCRLAVPPGGMEAVTRWVSERLSGCYRLSLPLGAAGSLCWREEAGWRKDQLALLRELADLVRRCEGWFRMVWGPWEWRDFLRVPRRGPARLEDAVRRAFGAAGLLVGPGDGERNGEG